MATLSEEFRFRDVYNQRVVAALASRLATALPGFCADAFAADACRDLEALGMNERIAQITAALRRALPTDFPSAAAALLAAQEPPQPEPGKTDWDAFIVLPQCRLVAESGRGHVALSLEVLRELTQRLSAEADLRTFLEVDYAKTWSTLERWCSDPDPHVRRLVSEGTRPRLPMAPRIRRFCDDPRPLLDLLARLRDDPSLYVRRSVANNLNDIAKDNPELALDVLERWQREASPNTRALVRHAARTLLKAGHPRALALFGLGGAAVAVTLSVPEPVVRIGGSVTFVAELVSQSDAAQLLHIDYVVDFVKADGHRRPKVFKWTERTLAPGEQLRLTRRQHMRPTSGRPLYPGWHSVSLQINGVRLGEAAFEVRAAP